MTKLSWLPEIADWRDRLKALPKAEDAWGEAVFLANTRLDFVRTNALDEICRRLERDMAAAPHSADTIRLAVLASCTVTHLQSAIRVAGLRRGLKVEIYESNFGQYWQELTDQTSGLFDFKPNVVLFVQDADHLSGGLRPQARAENVEALIADARSHLSKCWCLAREAFQCQIIQQTPLAVHVPVMGNNEYRLPGSRLAFIQRLNTELRVAADIDGVDLLAVDSRASIDGLLAWHDRSMWHRAKQEISMGAAPMYGEQVMRLIAAKKGRSYKCLVMDLDNTLWGGVVGDDGIEGLVIGQGSTLGEAFSAFQSYAKDLSARGVILAVCSKNDEQNALEPFDRHPEMVLKRADIACFVANWSDKASNIQSIAQQLNIGIDSLVFIDDNPFERTLVRQELPLVAVPEVGDDPTQFPRMLADAGYFEALSITDEDRARGGQYQENLQREAFRSATTDLPAYLRSLEMVLVARPFDLIGMQRTVQLINKTNQFNLTTRRYVESDVQNVIDDQRAFGLQLRLTDSFGDNGIIAIVIGKMQNSSDLLIDSWLMSCRVLGRQVEPTTLNLIVEQALRLNATRIIGEYIPTKKNGMVREHYQKLGFTVVQTSQDGSTRSVLDLANFMPHETFIQLRNE